jgi:hypothetical protein
MVSILNRGPLFLGHFHRFLLLFLFCYSLFVMTQCVTLYGRSESVTISDFDVAGTTSLAGHSSQCLRP